MNRNMILQVGMMEIYDLPLYPILCRVKMELI